MFVARRLLTWYFFCDSIVRLKPDATSDSSMERDDAQSEAA
jgi:hypothetical protein